ncbi:MAG: Crp/Fnr family transcriptional regulator, partial [Actinobacteria bacterium]|nr:Crp/Fnr family transcriptional regulator [Actinomycetota bacterium]
MGLRRDHLEERIKLLSAVDVLEPLAIEELEWVAQRIVDHGFQKGELVYAPGDASDVLFLLLAGSIRLYGMTGGRELTFDILRAGTIFGVASMMERTQDEYALALEPSRVGLLNLSAFWDVVRQNPQVIERVVRLLGDRLRLSRGRMMDIALKEVPARLASLLFDLVQREGIVTRGGYYKILSYYTHEQLATLI